MKTICTVYVVNEAHASIKVHPFLQLIYWTFYHRSLDLGSWSGLLDALFISYIFLQQNIEEVNLFVLLRKCCIIYMENTSVTYPKWSAGAKIGHPRMRLIHDIYGSWF